MSGTRTEWRVLGATLLVAAGALSACGGQSATDSVHINHSGGALTETYEDHWFGPLEDRTEMSVADSSPADLTRLQAQVDAGQVLWDVPELESGIQYEQAIDENLVESLDEELLQEKLDAASDGELDLAEDFIDGSVGTHGVWGSPFATVLVYDERVFPESGPQPDSLDDLWNVDEFPGKRCLSSIGQYNLEIALRADGVASEDLYPLDVDRALAKLETIKPEIAKFWRAGAEPIQLVAGGECVMSTVWNGRPFSADVQDGIDYLGIAWEHGIIDTSWRGVADGASNRDGAYEALAQYLTTEFGVAFVNASGYATGNVHIPDQIESQTREYLATDSDHLEQLTERDARWWLENGAEVEEAFAEWRRG